MKIVLSFSLIVAVLTTFEVNAIPVEKAGVPTRGLQEDLKEFLALIPVDKIEDIFWEYLADDEDFGEVIDYILSNKFKELVVKVESSIEFKNVLNYLQESGVDAYKFINKINGVLGIDKIKPYGVPLKLRITGGLPGFIKDVVAVIPIDKIEKWFVEKMKTSVELKALMNRLRSPKFHSLFRELTNNRFWRQFIDVAEAEGVNVQAIRDFLQSFIGIKFPGFIDSIQK